MAKWKESFETIWGVRPGMIQPGSTPLVNYDFKLAFKFLQLLEGGRPFEHRLDDERAIRCQRFADNLAVCLWIKGRIYVGCSIMGGSKDPAQLQAIREFVRHPIPVALGLVETYAKSSNECFASLLLSLDAIDGILPSAAMMLAIALMHPGPTEYWGNPQPLPTANEFEGGYGFAGAGDAIVPELWNQLAAAYATVKKEMLIPEDQSHHLILTAAISARRDGQYPPEAFDWSGPRGVKPDAIKVALPELHNAMKRFTTQGVVCAMDKPIGFTSKALNREVWVSFKSSFVAGLQTWIMGALQRGSARRKE